MKRIVSTIAVLLALAPSIASAAPQVHQPAPAFSLKNIDGKTITLASLKGKAVYLNFFATWCGPCNEEAPFIAKLAAKYKSKGLTTYGIDEQESRDKAVGFIKKYKLTYGVLLDDTSVGNTYGALGLPLHVFIDKKGIVKTYRIGEMNASEIEAAIKGAI